MNNLDVKVDVVDAMVVSMDNGALANVGSIGMIRPGDSDNLTINIYSDKGSIDLDFIQGTGKIGHANGTDERLPVLSNENELYPMRSTSTNLVDVITGKSVNGSPSEIGLRTVELLDAAYRSASMNGRVVDVDSLYQ